jgi:molybdopterin-binding protein
VGIESPAAANPINLVSLVTRHSADEMALAPGVAVIATFKASAVHLIER